jgi:endoglucanase
MMTNRINARRNRSPWLIAGSALLLLFGLCVQGPAVAEEGPTLNEKAYFQAPGVDVLVFSNWYDGLFSDSKISGVEIIHHGVRTATNGDVRLHATPEQWDPIPEFVDREVDRDAGVITARLRYPDFDFHYAVQVRQQEGALSLAVILPKPVPPSLEGKVGFNLEFLPSAYFGKSFLAGERSGLFPLYPTGPKERDGEGGTVAPPPLASAQRFVLAPDDPERTVRIESSGPEIALYDGRAKAQNGWFVLRSLLPAGREGTVLEWSLSPSSSPGWTRQPVIAHSQVGYHPGQRKVAVIELDPAWNASRGEEETATLYRFGFGGEEAVRQAVPKSWGSYKRYAYRRFDFSDITEPGVYALEYGGQRTAPFRVAADVYSRAWQPTLDVYFPVQMDHVLVNEAYRVWHGASHLDDALQAPVNHQHFDLYAQGPTTDTPFEPGQHIPGLNVGGWYDAGDYDIRTQTQYGVVQNLVAAWENFGIGRDNTTVDYTRRYVDIHVPDGQPDVLQQIRHGTLQLLAQFRAVGHAIAGIIVPSLDQYTHLGDGLTMTDNLVYNPDLGELESNGRESGVFDDRWAFTSRSSALNFGSIAALAAASRALKGFDDALSSECLDVARSAWAEEQSGEPHLFRHGNTTGGPLASEELRATLELLVTTGESVYADRFRELVPVIEENFAFHAIPAVRALPFLDESYRARVRQLAENYRDFVDGLERQNPYGVLITEGGWAGNGAVIGMAMNHWYLARAFPDLFNAGDVVRALDYLYGTHPHSNLSFVSGVGARSKRVAYGMNRADFSFIAGGIVPGVLILKPDYPENKEDWPFLWGENEYVISLGASYLFLVHAAIDLLGGTP